ncbi:MAG: ABC transporter permease [Anaerolineae bacterium]
MGKYLIQRLLAFVPTVLVMSLLVFLMIDFVPGDPVALLLGLEASGEAINAKRIELGLHRPLPERMAKWYINAIRGDLGDSFFLHASVTEAIVSRLPVTYSLAIFALVLASAIGIVTGVIAAIKQGTIADWGLMLLAVLGLSIPSFWLALNLISFFAIRLKWFPLGGFVSPQENFGDYLKHLLLPGISLGVTYAAMIARMTRASMLEVLSMDYVRTARAKGLEERLVIVRHALRNALIPIITVFGIAAGGLLGGSAIVETVFTLHGVGRLVVEAVQRRDYPVIQGGILVITFTYLVVNLLVDLLYVWANPRITYE